MPPPTSAPSASVTPAGDLIAPRLEDVTAKAGIHWVHNAGRTGKKYLPETVGGGGGFLDYDHDGYLDILLVDSGQLPGSTAAKAHIVLYHNNHDGTFTDVSRQAGLTLDEYGIGVAVGDFDHDGYPDIFVTAVGQTHLFHNNGSNKSSSTLFTDVTAKAHAGVKGFTTAACWFDYDRDGRLDLYVARYVEWTPKTDLPCGPVNARQYCPPNQYQGAPPVLLHNRGDGTFEDVSQKAGVLGHSSKTLAVTPYDFNGDGWIDLHIANDTEPDLLLINNKNGTFTDKALSAGVAVGTDGGPTGSMGVDVATPFGNNRATIAIGVFAGQELSLFTAANDSGDPTFENRKQEAGVADTTRLMTTFGLVFADVDNDGWPDLFVMNGHIDDDQSLSIGGKGITYKQLPQLFQNRHDGTFREVGAAAGLTVPLVGRGLAVGDYDNDGKPDFLLFENGGPVRLYHNTTTTTNAWIGVELVGKRSPKEGTGAMVTVTSKGVKQTRCATTSRSYLSANDPRLLFGVGANGAEELTVRWPSGQVTSVPNPERNRYLRLIEP